MSEEEKQAIEHIKYLIEFTEDVCLYSTDNKSYKIVLNLIDKLQKDNKRKIKIIDLLIDDFQLEGYLQFESKDDVLSYYNRRINLEEGNE